MTTVQQALRYFDSAVHDFNMMTSEDSDGICEECDLKNEYHEFPNDEHHRFEIAGDCLIWSLNAVQGDDARVILYGVHRDITITFTYENAIIQYSGS